MSFFSDNFWGKATMERLVLQIIDYKTYLWYRPESMAGRGIGVGARDSELCANDVTFCYFYSPEKYWVLDVDVERSMSMLDVERGMWILG